MKAYRNLARRVPPHYEFDQAALSLRSRCFLGEERCMMRQCQTRHFFSPRSPCGYRLKIAYHQIVVFYGEVRYIGYEFAELRVLDGTPVIYSAAFSECESKP